jgi:VWFA-related protein
MFYGSHILRSLGLLLLTALVCGELAPTDVRGQARPSPQQQSRPRRAGEAEQSTTPSSSKGEVVGQDEVVRVETNLTNILFTAVDKDRRFITTLRQEDVRVLEDGVPQEIFTFQRETDRPLTLAILIDVSISQMMTLPGEKAAARAFVNSIVRPQKDEVAIISFTGEATVEQELTTDVGRALRAIDRVEIVLPPEYTGGGPVIPGASPSIYGTDPRMGTTAIWDAVWATSSDLLSETKDQKRRAIILLTDGDDTSSRIERSEAIDRAVKADTVIYSIGIGDRYNFKGVEENTLRKLSERTGGRAYFPKDGQDLRAAFAQIEQELRSQYLVAYSPTNKARDGSFRKVQIEVVNPALRKEKLRLTYRPGYFARTATTPAAGSPTRVP